MRIPRDFEYIVHRPGNPETHSLGNGNAAGPNAALGVMRLAKRWLEESPYVVLEATRMP